MNHLKIPTTTLILTMGLCFGLALSPNLTLAAPTDATNPTASVAAAPPAPVIPTVPAAPLGASMVANSTDSITLSWYRSPSDEIKSYNVYSATTKEGPFTQIATVTERTATIPKLTPDTTYFYKISAVNAQGEGAQTAAIQGFTTVPVKSTPFPVRIAKNMCVSLGATIISTPAPSYGTLSNLVDGSDGTSAGFTGPSDVKIKLNPSVSIKDAEYLLLNFRTDNTGKSYPYNINWRSLKNYVITESTDSTDGKDGTWTEVVTGTNTQLDGVVVIPNHQPKWIGIKNSGDMQLCRLDLFRSAPVGFRNDYWIFTGDSLVVQDLAGGAPDRFSDLVRKRNPDRYPIVVQAAQGGEMLENTLGRMKKTIPLMSPPNGTATPTATIVCWESGFNDVGVSAGLWIGKKINQSLTDALALCNSNGLIMIPVRIEYSTGYLDKTTLEPAKYNVFYNTLAANLAGVDPFARINTPYAVDPTTGLPYADYWTYTRNNYATALSDKDGVHHTKAGAEGINQLWSEVADKMIYSKQK